MPSRQRTVKKSSKGRDETKGKSPRFYPADDIKKPIQGRRTGAKPTKLRASITPGTVLILLAGRFRGKRVVFLKQLSSGTLLVSGPFKINGVPLRRVNQAYVIATSTIVDVSSVPLPDGIDDAYFAREEKKGKKSEEDQFFAAENKKTEVSDQRKTDQVAVDNALLDSIKQVPMLKAYLSARFSLKGNAKPHAMTF